MDSYNGIFSLLFASIELLLLLNLLKFADKTKENWIAISMVALLFGYQTLETMLCFFEINSQVLVYLAIAVISFLPPLGLLLVFTLAGNKNKLLYLIFIPALFFTVYYLINIPQLNLTACSIIAAKYNMPLGTLYGVFYYIPIILSMLIIPLFYIQTKFGIRKKLWRVLMIGYYGTIIPAVLFYLVIPGFVDAAESGVCKLAFIMALALSYFAIANRKGN